MESLIVVSICLLAGVASTYTAIYKIRPESFRLSAAILRYFSFAMEIKLPAAAGSEARKIVHSPGGHEEDTNTQDGNQPPPPGDA